MTLNELDILKQRADQMGITYKSNIGVEALKAKINARLDDQPDPGDGAEGGDETTATTTAGAESAAATQTNEQASLPATETQHAPTGARPAVTAEQIAAAKPGPTVVTTQSQAAPAATQQAPAVTQPTPAAQPQHLTKAQQEQAYREEMQREQMKLIRCRITCLNPLKAQIKGEIITVANRYLGTVRKMVPFGEQTDEGFHIPKVLFDELKSRKFNSVTTKKGPNGQRLPVSRLVPEFAIEVLDPLTEEELAELAAAQAAVAGG